MSWTAGSTNNETKDAETGGAVLNWADADQAPHVSSTSNENWQDSTENDKPSTSTKSSSGRGCKFWTCLALGIVFTILFVISASLEFNDVSLVFMWATFYIIQAILAIIGLIRLLCCKGMLTMPILIVSLAMLLWSLVLIGLAAADFSKAVPGGETQGGDTDNRTNKEEIGYELGGAILGTLSTIYHICLVKCCDKKPEE